ncbi:hypothetical protein EDD11_009206 [Mortierella claussenii]|nr:hypothetical protein EDD11_009206 [Mortierella claussenii]
MENGIISRLASSTDIQKNSHHYLPIIMTSGSKISGSAIPSIELDPNTAALTSEAPAAVKNPSALNSEPTTSVMDPGTRHSKSLQGSLGPRTLLDGAKTTSTHQNGIQESSSISVAVQPDPTPSTQLKSSALTTDLIDGALSDFDGSDLSDLSSASTESASDSGSDSDDVKENSSEENNYASNRNKGGEDEKDEPIHRSSVSDDSDSHSHPRQKKRPAPKKAARSKHIRRIESDSSDSDQGRDDTKAKPGRSLKLKSHPGRSRVTQSPTSPSSSASLTFNAKKLNGDTLDKVDMGHGITQTGGDAPQPKKKAKLPDFVNIGKRDRSGRTQLFKYTAMGDLETCRRLIEAGAEVNDRDYADWTPLHEACVTGHEKVAELLIQHQADVNACGGHMDTPLHDAAQNGHVEVVKLLLSHGANIQAKNAKGIVPLDVADDKEVIDLLQRRQALVNMLTGKNQAGQTLLHRSCSSGSYNTVIELLNQGADINAQDNAQWTPLHEAALEGHTKIVELLLSRGADPNARGHGNDTALHDSAQNEHEDVVRLLLEYGADPDIKNSKAQKPCDVTEDQDILRLLKTGARGIRKPVSKSAGSITSSSSSLSSLSSHSSKASTLPTQSSISVFGKGSNKSNRRKEGIMDTNMSDEGRSPSEERPAQLSRDERKMQQLISTIRMQEQMEERKKAKKRQPKEASDDDGDEDDHSRKSAQRSNSKSSTSVWGQPHSKEHRSKASQKSKSSRSVTKASNGSRRRSSRSEEREDSDSGHEKSRRSKRSVQRSAGDRFRIDHRYKDSLGRTQLHQWAESGDIEMVGTLLEGGAERDPRDHDGLTPIHLAAKAGNTDVLVLLLAYGCDMNAQDQDKATALHEAVRYHHVEAVRLLLQNNALVGLRDSKKRTCLELASSKDIEIRALLKSSMEQAELKAKERSKKRLSQSIESHGSPRHKERKTSRHSDSDEAVRLKKKDAERRDVECKKHSTQHSRNGSLSGPIKSISMPVVSSALPVSTTNPVSSNIPTSTASEPNLPTLGAITTTTTARPTSAADATCRQNDLDMSGDDATIPRKHKAHSRPMSFSGMSSNMQEEDDVEMKPPSSGPASKKRRETDRHSDGYGGKVKIKKERDDDGQQFKSSVLLSSKAEDLRRVASLPSFSKDHSATTTASKLSRHASKPSFSSVRPASVLGMTTGSSIASISPPLTENSSSPPPPSSTAQALTSQENEVQRSRKRSSQTFASPSGYQKFADDLRLGSSTLHHQRQRSVNSAPTSRSSGANVPAAAAAGATGGTTYAEHTESTSVASTTDVHTGRKKAKMSATEPTTTGPGSLDDIKKLTVDKALSNGVATVTSPSTNIAEGGTAAPMGLDRIIKKEELADNPIPPYRSVQDAQRYLPLYTVQLSDETSLQELAAGQQFCVVDRQIQLLLGLPPETLSVRYPHLHRHRRLISRREKARLWSPLSSMVSERCAAAVKLNFEVLPMPVVECQFSNWTTATTAMSRLKEHEKQKFLGCELYFIRLEEVLEVIRQDYAQLNESMMTITLDIGYEDDDASTSMDVAPDSTISTLDSSTNALRTIKKEEKEQDVNLQLVKKEEVEVKDERPLSLSSNSFSSSTSPTHNGVHANTLPVAHVSGGAGYVHKMRRVPAKMATKAMFKKLQQQLRPSSSSSSP